MTVNTPYPRYAVYPVLYLRFLTVYERIWTVIAGGTPQTRVQFLAKAIFALFGPSFFLAVLLTEHSLNFLLAYMHVFALNALYNVWLW